MSAAAVRNTDAEVGVSAGCQARGGRAENTACSPGRDSNPGASLLFFSPCPLPHSLSCCIAVLFRAGAAAHVSQVTTSDFPALDDLCWVLANSPVRC